MALHPRFTQLTHTAFIQVTAKVRPIMDGVRPPQTGRHGVSGTMQQVAKQRALVAAVAN